MAANLSGWLTKHYPRRIHYGKRHNHKANSEALIQLRARQSDSLGFN
jgi:hypothetical protein